MKNVSQPLSIHQIERAIVIDFEGFMNRSPSLVGTLIDNHYRCWVFSDVDGFPAKELPNYGTSSYL